MFDDHNSFFDIYLKSYENHLFLKRWEYSLKGGKNAEKQNALFLSVPGKLRKYTWLIKLFLPIFLFLYLLSKMIITLFSKVLVGNLIYELDVIDKIYINTNGLVIPLKKGMLKEDDYVLEYPQKWIDKELIPRLVNILQLISYKDIWQSFSISCLSCCKLLVEKGYCSLIYGFTSFQLCCLYYALNHFSDTVELLTSSQKDRWVTLIDNAKQNNKSIIQHGTNYIRGGNNMDGLKDFINECEGKYYLNLPHKLRTITKIYSFNETEAKYMLMGEHENHSISVIYIGYLTKFSEVNIERKTALIIGNAKYYYNIEKHLVSLLTSLNYYVFLKNHPLCDASVYNIYKDNEQFELITDRDFNPSTQIVFSYNSTLANEYECNGCKVIFYDSFLNDGVIDMRRLKGLV